MTLWTRDDDDNNSFWGPKVKDTSNCYAFGSRLSTVAPIIVLGSVVGGKERRFVQLFVGATLVDTLRMRYARISRALRYTELSDMMM